MDIARLIVSKMSGENPLEDKSPAHLKMDEQALIAGDILSALKKADARLLSHALAAFIKCCEIEVEEEDEKDY
jgi:hypothetical protein